MPTYSPAAPWNGPYPQLVTDEFGNEWEAVGLNQLKKPSWTPPVNEMPEDCCTYLTASNETLVEGVQPALIGGITGSDKSDGDTTYQKHPNGFSWWECAGGAWTMHSLCIFPEQEEIPDPEKETFKAGDTLPADAGEVEICVDNDGLIERVTFPAGGGALPANMVGCVQLDETDGSIGWFGKAPKSRQEMFCPGEDLPLWAADTVSFSYFDPTAPGPDGSGGQGGFVTVELAAGDTIPVPPTGDTNDNGIQRDPCLHVDPCTGLVTCVATNPAVHLRCLGAYSLGTPGIARLSTLEVVHCDGTRNYFQPSKVSADGANGTVNVDSTTPVGPLAGTEFCTFAFLTPPCGRQRVTLSYVHGWNAFNGWDKPDNAALLGRPEYSLDGGVSWIPMGWGGVDTVLSNDAPQGESEFNDEAEPLTNPGVVYEVCFRYNLLANPTTAGIIQLQAQTGKWDAINMNCCYGVENAIFNADPLGDL